MMLEHRQIQVELGRAANALRGNQAEVDISRPRFVEVDRYFLAGRVFRRIRIMLRGNGCRVPTCTMCPLPNAAANLARQPVSAINFVQQVEHALRENPGCEMACIYNDGNFFSNRELPDEARRKIYELVRSHGFDQLMVESLPRYVTPDRIGEARDLLGTVSLVVGIGLQSASKIVRELCVNTPLQEEEFFQANSTLRKLGCKIKTYILVKPPFLSEAEAVDDAVTSALWLRDLGIDDVTLCPTRVAPGTVLYDLFVKGLYTPPVLSTVVHCLIGIHEQGGHARVSVFNVHSLDYAAHTPSGCAACELRIVEGLVRYNENQDPVDMHNLVCPTCDMKAVFLDPPLFAGLSIEERVAQYLDQVSTGGQSLRISHRLRGPQARGFDNHGNAL